MRLIHLSFIFAALILMSGCAGPAASFATTPNTETTASTTPSTTFTTTPTTSATPSTTTTPPPATETAYTIHGSLEIVENVPILRLWGSHYDMGYAYGYLCADKIMEGIEGGMFFFFEQNPDVSYEMMVDRMNRYIIWSKEYIAEAQGCLDGMESDLGTMPTITSNIIEAGSKQVDLEMLLLLNGFGHIMNVAGSCSGFAAWGEATGDGKTRVGGNVDLTRETAPNYLLVVRKPNYGLSTVCLNYYAMFLGGAVGPTKGMNETGLAMTTQGAYNFFNPPWTPVTEPGYTFVILRDILEQVAAGPNMVSTITEIFQMNNSNFAGTLLFAQKRPDGENIPADQMAMVIEKDPLGFDVRLPSHNSLYGTAVQDAIFATNHFIHRYVPDEYPPDASTAGRYWGMVAAVIDHVVAGLPGMQIVLQGAAEPGSIHSMYMEPDTLTIHIGYGTVEGPPSPFVTPVTFTWDELFAPIPD